MKHRKSRFGTEFNSLLTASFVSNLGDGVRMAALPLLATTVTSSVFLISAITAAQFLPWTTFAPFGGLIVDRSDRRRLIVVTQAWRAMVMALLALAVLTNTASIWMILAVAFMITVGEIMVDPSVVATLPTLVGPAKLDEANGRLSAVEVVSDRFLGTPLGAFSFAIAPWFPFVVDAVSYAGSILPFSRVPSPRLERTSTESIRNEMAGGLRWIMGHQFLRPLTAGIAVFHLGSSAAISLLVVLAIDVLEAPTSAYGIVLTGAAVGATVASSVASRLTDRFPRRNVVCAATTATALTVLLAGLSTAVWQLTVIWALNGASSAIQLAIGRGFVQRHTPADRLGRTAVASRMVTRTSFVVGALFAGGIATALSVRWAFGAAAAFHLAGTVLLWRAFKHEPADDRPVLGQR